MSDTTAVVVFCDGRDGHSHPTRECNVGMLTVRQWAPGGSVLLLPGGGTELAADSLDVSSVPAWEQRIRFDFRCSICGLSLAARHETLSPIAAQLVGQDVSRVSLRGLLGIVASASSESSRKQ